MIVADFQSAIITGNFIFQYSFIYFHLELFKIVLEVPVSKEGIIFPTLAFVLTNLLIMSYLSQLPLPG